jgi:alkylation response protein AidB-like acyl-CoA dehydrogenase
LATGPDLGDRWAEELHTLDLGAAHFGMGASKRHLDDAWSWVRQQQAGVALIGQRALAEDD